VQDFGQFLILDIYGLKLASGVIAGNLGNLGKWSVLFCVAFCCKYCLISCVILLIYYIDYITAKQRQVQPLWSANTGEDSYCCGQKVSPSLLQVCLV